ncbi:AraC family transcriptional regulator [Diplocloster modestus]|uniref:AraC family transcriptional regulator n=1 Tax=Diplocloster modestus TaxID=2850322 RepID=A0ABS6KB20_9FIRM|nr:AraC family transcriptional regulator [Diplocloster modestus]MBU9727706.1 AraC family transcriptional regulator [Diplocloster modestus]
MDNVYTAAFPDGFPFEMNNAKGNMVLPPVLHRHDCLELNYVICGSGTNYIEDKKYEMKAGELYLINNLEHHIAVSGGDLKMKIILFDPGLLFQNTAENLDLLAPFYSKNAYFSNKLELGEVGMEKIHRIFEDLEEEWTHKEPGYHLLIKAKLMELTGILYRYLKREDTLKSTLSYQNQYEKIRPSIQYINENYEQELTLEVLAELSFMSKSYFSTYFKKVTNMTLWEYIELIRIHQAQLMLATENQSVTDISFSCGFHSVSSFNTSFKKITGLTPSMYRKSLLSP